MKKFAWIIALIAGAGMAIAEDAAPKKDGPPGGGRRPGMMFEEMDANKDGKVTKDEFQGVQDKRIDEQFGRLDKNGDGSIGKDELPPAPPADSPRARFMPDLSKMDKDADGKITKEEFSAGSKELAKERFAKMDKDSDGAISKEEMEAVRAQFSGRRGGPGGEGEKKDAK